MQQEKKERCEHRVSARVPHNKTLWFKLQRQQQQMSFVSANVVTGENTDHSS